MNNYKINVRFSTTNSHLLRTVVVFLTLERTMDSLPIQKWHENLSKWKCCIYNMSLGKLNLISKHMSCWYHGKQSCVPWTWLRWGQQSSAPLWNEVTQDRVTGGHRNNLSTHIIWFQSLIKMVLQSSFLFFCPVTQWSIKAGGSIWPAIHATVRMKFTVHLQKLASCRYNAWEAVWHFRWPYYKSFLVNKEGKLSNL